MTTSDFARNCVLAAGALFLVGLASLSAEDGMATAGESVAAAPQHDGQHDFDFLIGSWIIHLKRLVHPMSDSDEWVELDGTTVCRTVLEGRAEVEEFDVANREKHMHIQGLALRFYNPVTHQWSIWWANAKDGAMYPPPVVGEFKDGRGEFYDQDVFEGRTVLTRFVWTGTTTNAPHFEQSISTDGGKTWKLWWTTDQTRVKP
jgi:hypothetical protein